MSKSRCLAFVVLGTVMTMASLLLAASGTASAESAAGTWTSTIPDEGYFDHTWPADFTYDAKLTLNSGGSGSFRLECTDVTVNQPGWESALEGLGMVNTVGVDYSESGSSVTLRVRGGDGATYTFPLTLDGNRLHGSGSYTDGSGTVNSWTMDLTRGGSSLSMGGLSGLSGIAAAASIGGFLVGFSVSLLPPPRFMGGSILPQNNTVLGTPYAPSQSLASFRDQTGAVTRPLPDVPRMKFGTGPIQFPNVEMGRQTDIHPTDIHPTDLLSKRFCQYCGSPLMATAAGWSCPSCSRAPPGGLDR